MIASVETPPIASPQDTVDALIEKSARSDFVSVRRAFVQHGRRSALSPGPLHVLVGHHDELALDLYLLTRLLASHTPFEAQLSAAVWARALGLPGPSGPAAISRAWKRLADLGLVSRGRRGRTAFVRVLLEDGSGNPFVQFGARADPYFKIPLEYWRDDWQRKLDLPAKAALLIALSLPDGFYLPTKMAKRWYGVSADTVERGLAKLRELGILKRTVFYKGAPLAAQGWTREHHYGLKPPFGPQWAVPQGATVEREGVRLKVM
jgi:DNA-binding transcriptional ArsR family regulator